MDNIHVVREKSKNNFPKIIFKDNIFKSTKVSIDTNNFEKKKHIKTNKYLSLFRTEFNLNSNLSKNIMKYFHTHESTTGNITAQNLSLTDSTNYRYSVLKTYLSKPEMKYSSKNVSITFYIFNKKNMYTLKKLQTKFNLMQQKFNIVKAKFKNNSNIALFMTKLKKLPTFNTLNKSRTRKSMKGAKHKNKSRINIRYSYNSRLKAE